MISRPSFWLKLFADIFNERVVTLETQEGSAYGAALLALVGTGEYASVAEICRKALHETETKEPGADSAEFYKRRYAIYRSLYPALKPAFESIGKLDG